MEKNKKYTIKGAGVLLIAAALILTSVAVTADTVKEKMNPAFLRSTGPSISIENSPATTGAVIFEQLPYEPEESWIFMTSAASAGYRVWDEYWELNEQICDIHWWGLSLVYPWAACDPSGMVFEIIFWDALLGNPVCTYQVTPTGVSTGKFYSGFEMFYWEAILDPCCDLIPNGWVSIQSVQSPNNCWLLWAGSDEGDLYCYQEGSTTPDQVDDAAFQLTAEGEPAYPKIICDPVGMNFGKAGPGATVTGQIYVCNGGDPGSYLDWYVDTAAVPTWGTWTFTPAGGTGVAEGDCVVVDVTCVVTDTTGTYNGEITVYNAKDSTDYCKIDTSVEVPRARSHNALMWNLFQQFPALYQIVKIIFGA
ncbi:MAG: hypothetical protein AYK22_01415 [Thermoplasmatales archaeon SG8-52-3]|nr:MAG: hypothetical protein AYK22_01415 [Thermoplasmatales archaeon SG8-52-3]